MFGIKLRISNIQPIFSTLSKLSKDNNNIPAIIITPPKIVNSFSFLRSFVLSFLSVFIKTVKNIIAKVPLRMSAQSCKIDVDGFKRYMMTKIMKNAQIAAVNNDSLLISIIR